jgi:hypothetical protein
VLRDGIGKPAPDVLVRTRVTDLANYTGVEQ